MATKAPAVTETPAVSTPYAEILKHPETITLLGNAHQVLDEMILHARSGYRLYEGVSPTILQNGVMSILLQRGDPMPLVYQRAKESIANEQRKESAEFERRVNEEAARRVAANAQAELDARIAAVEALAEAEVSRVRAQVAAERARIEASL